ncbi:MAG: cupin domain-containing protein [Moorea sp. SIO3I7]|uniref:cupin domain-containing protein n=1 Tax=Moorena sp. SIO3I8 TaxID=2607833 RepID=UPI0013C0A877|nr:cupin domain-containing protein [Moorena sp. SIO3I8]NEN95885.1 cupin domain-containing protein [Moorena sp. SIO3I7]NEO05127.1 cupin domain-containing protein [Moorena sp. SIO3I8]NEO43678.1 cupin domain-containing protein [Moorena sp. SIO4A3]
MDAEYIIQALQLVPHPEGGFYREMYRSDQVVKTPFGVRSVATSIYYLLRSGEYSSWHRIRSDELWFYHAGVPLCLNYLDETGSQRGILLGASLTDGAHPYYCLPGGTWFGAIPSQDDSFSLVSCVVAPGFDFADFELAESGVFPQISRELL